MITANSSLTDLGFSAYFRSQLSLEELENLLPVRVAEVQRDRLTALGENGQLEVVLTASNPSSDIAVGDWILIDLQHRLVRLLSPKSSLRRRAAGTDANVQLIANNVDTLFIVMSCNADFSEARLERYLALSNEAEVTAVVLLTKADLSNKVAVLQAKAESLMEHLIALSINATDPTVIEQLKPWCSSGQTVALVGSSGVGKTTLLNVLTGESLETQGIREDDAKGRQTTTFRAMRRIRDGGWIIDTPGMRALRLYDNAEGIDAVFDEISEKEFLLPHIERDIDKSVSDSKSIFLKAVADDVVGFILIKDFWHLVHLFIAPNCQNRGLGKALLQRGFSEVNARENRGYICLNSSQNAVAFYENMGFVIDTARAPKSKSSTPMRYEL